MGKPIAFFEVVSDDSERAQTFYASLFDWSVSADPALGGYGLVDTGAGDGAIGGGIGPSQGPGDAGVKIYVRVDDLLVRRQGSGTEAWTALTRRDADFPRILGAYDALGRWIDDSGMQRAGSPAEVYLTPREAADADPDRVHLEVVWPVSPR